MNRKEELKPGDTVIWNDGSVGMLIELIDVFGLDSPNLSREWSWVIAWPNNPPCDYNKSWGEHPLNVRKL